MRTRLWSVLFIAVHAHSPLRILKPVCMHTRLWSVLFIAVHAHLPLRFMHTHLPLVCIVHCSPCTLASARMGVASATCAVLSLQLMDCLMPWSLLRPLAPLLSRPSWLGSSLWLSALWSGSWVPGLLCQSIQNILLGNCSFPLRCGHIFADCIVLSD